MSWLDRLREKPRHVRDNYAFLGAASFLAVVFCVWALSLPLRFAGFSQISVGVENVAAVGGTLDETAPETTTVRDTLGGFTDSIMRFYSNNQNAESGDLEPENVPIRPIYDNPPADPVTPAAEFEQIQVGSGSGSSTSSTSTRSIRIATSTTSQGGQ